MTERTVGRRWWRSATPFLILAIAPFGAVAQADPPADTAAHAEHMTPQTPHAMMMPGPLGLPAARDGSGTSWLPDATPMYARHVMAGAWELMLHGNAFAQYIHQGSDRGDTQFGSINWLMGMGRRALAGGELTLRAMMSAEPFTIPGCGYPILLATGEVCEGEPIHDAQHPHDLFMELAAQYEREVSDALAIELYGGFAGEPALGPVAYPHRASALPNPLAPISHHWFDATHITFGVLTGGVYGRSWKLEGSLFNGREPDEDRLGIDLAPLDSYAGRISWLSHERWAFQLSAGRLNEAEPGHEAGEPRVDVNRYTTSATYHRPLTGSGSWATTVAFGRNVEEGTGTSALLVESSLSLAERHSVFGRAEWTQKPGHDLALEDPRLEEGIHDVGALSAGYVRQFGPWRGWVPGVGLQASLNLLPEDLEPVYGGRSPAGFTLFVNVRPAAMPMPEMPMAPMPQQATGSGRQ